MKIFDGDDDKNELEVEHDNVIGVGLVDAESSDSARPEGPGPDDNMESDTSQKDVAGEMDTLSIRRPKITIDSSIHPVAHTLRQITNQLISSGNCFRRCGQLVTIYNGQITPIRKAIALAGFLSQFVEFYFTNGDSGHFRPLSGVYANSWLYNQVEFNRLPEIKLFTRHPVFTTDWRVVTPGYDVASGIYYAGPSVVPREGTTHLDALLSGFCFKSKCDRDNYIGMLLTPVLIPRFIGTKPIELITGNQPGVGKSILAQIVAIIRDGHYVGTATYNPNDEEFEKRIGAMVRSGNSTIIVDNAKPNGRNPRIESSVLERSTTDPILSYRLLGHSSSFSVENSHSFIITANSPRVGNDISTRSVYVNLYHEGAPERRRFVMRNPEEYALEHRTEIIGELLGMVFRWIDAKMPMADVNTRFNKSDWGDIIGGILAANGHTDFLKNAEEAAEQLDETRRGFAELVAILAANPQSNRMAAELVEICSEHGLLAEELGSGTARSLATKMGNLAGRFVDVRFSLEDGRVAKFEKREVRKGFAFAVSISDEAEGAYPKT